MTRSRIAWWLWMALLVSLPITSYPLISDTFGESVVSPLAVIPLTALLAIWVIPEVVRTRSLPALSRPLIAFLAIALLSASMGAVRQLGPYKGQTPLDRELRALITLGVGFSFYLCASKLPDTTDRLRTSLQALTIGGALTLLWALMQALVLLLDNPDVTSQINQLHRVFSIRDLLPNRVTGFAYEPSWLGNQQVILYSPVWLASVATGYSAFRRVRGYLSVELMLAVAGVLVLVLARSRLSVVGGLALIGLLLLAGAWRYGRRWSKPGSAFLRGAAIALAVIVLLGILVGTSMLARALDPRFARAFTIQTELPAIKAEHPYEWGFELANRVAFAERVVFWGAGWGAFEAFPILGIGLGNAGFLFEQTMPAYGHRLTEIRAALDASNPNFPNPKSLWVRLLAETGVLGFVAFATWLIIVLAGSLSLRRSRTLLIQVVGLAGVLAVATQILEGFSLDTFALPQIWIVPALVTAAYELQSANNVADNLSDPKYPSL